MFLTEIFEFNFKINICTNVYNYVSHVKKK